MLCKEEDLRTAALLGADAMERLRNARVAVFGIGGVGGHLAEALARAGVGALDLFDGDVVARSNINRQAVALQSTVGHPKVEVMRARILDINPDCRVTAHHVFYLPEVADAYPLKVYDYVADAVDTVSAKLELAVRATQAGIPILSAMGAGNKLDPTHCRVSDLSKTEGCPLAKVMRRELKARGIRHLPVVFSPEPPSALPPDAPAPLTDEGRAHRAPASVSFVPSVMGLIMAGEIIRRLSSNKEQS